MGDIFLDTSKYGGGLNYSPTVILHFFFVLIVVKFNNYQFQTYWKRESKQNPIGDQIAKIGLICFTQSYTERVVKTVRETESRFVGYDEVKESESKIDRAKQEI